MVVSAPVGQGADLLPVSRLITFGDKTHHCSLSTLSPEPVIPAKKPFKVELVGGKRYLWAQQEAAFLRWKPQNRTQGLSPLRFVPEKDIWLCGCKHTSNPPYCDGTHKQDFIVSAPLHEPAES
uniref:Iron-binding zinc finger CDGSH type domain-containing protein n=1 Tax=Pundamilia nyererei TaxID=303518 RepID=A0A3B4FV83_9CICH